jgi:hypothetical protein
MLTRARLLYSILFYCSGILGSAQPNIFDTVIPVKQLHSIVIGYLNNYNNQIASLTHSKSKLTALTFSPDSKILLSSDGLDIKTWHTENGKLKEALHEPCSSFLYGFGHSAIFSPDNQYIVATSFSEEDVSLESQQLSDINYSIVYWNLTHFNRYPVSLREFDELPQRKRSLSQIIHQTPVRALACSPNGTDIAFAYNQQVIISWQAVNAQEKQVFDTPEFIIKLAYSDSGDRLAACSENILSVWDTTEFKLLKREIYNRPIISLYYSETTKDFIVICAPPAEKSDMNIRQPVITYKASAHYLATIYDHNTLSIYDTDKKLVSFPSIKTTYPIEKFAVSPNGNYLAIGDSMGNIHILQNQIAALSASNKSTGSCVIC